MNLEKAKDPLAFMEHPWDRRWWSLVWPLPAALAWIILSALLAGCAAPSHLPDPSRFTLRSAHTPRAVGRAPARRVCIAVPGIFFSPGDVQGWPEQFCRWGAANRPEIAFDRMEYHSDAVFRAAGQCGRIADLQYVIRSYTDAGLTVSLVCHSNGAALGTGTLADRSVKLCGLTLLSPVCEASWDDNGLNLAQWQHRVENVMIGMALQDDTIGTWARLSRWPPLSWIPGFSYGLLGVDGPQGVWVELDGLVDTWRRDGGHSIWWDSDQFADTMRRVTGI